MIGSAKREAATIPTARLRKQLPAAMKSGSRRYHHAGRMAPRSASRNPETRNPARALPPPDARVSAVLPAMFTVFDFIISDRRVGQATKSDGLSTSVLDAGFRNP